MKKKSPCCHGSQRAWAPREWIAAFYKPFLEMLETIDIKHCDCCGKTYRLSWIQIIGCGVLFAVWTVLLWIGCTFAGVFGFVAALAVYPLVLEIPRRYLPWKEVENFLYKRWKSRVGLILAHEFGMIGAAALLFAVADLLK